MEGCLLGLAVVVGACTAAGAALVGRAAGRMGKQGGEIVVLLSCVLACLKRHNEQAFYMNDGAFYYPRGSSYQGVNVNVKSPGRHPANRV